MKLVVGLGNPGRRYQGTRHNVGFVALDKLARELRMKNYELQEEFQTEVTQSGDLFLAKPQTFMNRSGIAVSKLATSYQLQATDLYVVHDDLDIPLGKYKIHLGKGPREHGGLTSIYQSLGNREFWHVRIGIENRIQQAQSARLRRGSGGQAKRKVQSVDSLQHFQIQKTSDSIRISGEKYVLQRFAEEEKAVIERVIRTVVDDLLGRLTEA